MSRDWQADIELLNQCGDSGMPYNETEFSRMLPYWLQEVKQLKEDNARWTCKHTAAEQNYQTQSGVIAELRKQLEIAQLAYEGLQGDCVTRGEYDSLLDKHTVLTKARRAEKERADKAEEREQKLIKALERVKHHTKDSHAYSTSAYAYHEAHKVLATIYPLVREGTSNAT